MYYHCRELKYVSYGKVYPAHETLIDQEFLNAYKWLGKYCNFCPQIWLSRSKSDITGYKANITNFGIIPSEKKDWIMFGFENVVGFPVDYDLWCFFLTPLANGEDPYKHAKQMVSEMEKDGSIDYPLSELNKMDFDEFLKKYLFVEKDQVVVPSLNLKAAKKVFCQNEKQFKQLTRMGFIKDRIEIRNRRYKS